MCVCVCVCVCECVCVRVRVCVYVISLLHLFLSNTYYSFIIIFFTSSFPPSVSPLFAFLSSCVLGLCVTSPSFFFLIHVHINSTFPLVIYFYNSPTHAVCLILNFIYHSHPTHPSELSFLQHPFSSHVLSLQANFPVP